MKRIGMKKASYMFFFLVMGMIFAAGCSKKPGEGGDIILSSADNTQSQENTGTTEPATEETSEEAVTETTTEAVTETTQPPVEEVKPWDLLNNEPLNPATSGYEELDRLIGAVCYMPVFIPEYGIGRGIWYSVFHSISSFCNAGIDIVGANSFMPYVHNVWVNLVTMTLIVFGGIGFVVWWDVVSAIRKKIAGSKRHLFQLMSLHSKVAITMTLFLILSGTVLFAVFEWNNPRTMGEFSGWQKWLAALFQSVTTRTAGIATISQKGLSVPSVITSMFLMFTGGSSVGTAGGVKVTTVAVVILSVAATVRGNSDVTCYGRRISDAIVRKSVAIIFISFMASVLAILAMRLLEGGESVDIIFEVYSALGTVGLSRDYTATVGIAGKIVLCICMFLGRIGPITMVIAFAMRDKKTALRLPEGKITVG